MSNDASGRGTSSPTASISGNSMPVSRCMRRAVANCAGVGSMPTGRAPRFAIHAEKYAVPHPSSTTSRPSSFGKTRSSDSGMRQIPHVISSCAHDSAARASVYSAFARVQLATFCATYSGNSDELIVCKPQVDLALRRLRRIGTVDEVVRHCERQVAADRARICVRGIRRADRLAQRRDCALPFDDERERGAGSDELADLRATHRAVQVTARQSVLHRTDLELTLAHVFEVLGRAEQHVDEWTDERNQAEADARPDEEGVLDAAARIFKDPVGEAEPEQREHEEREPPRDAPRPRAEEVVDAAEGAGDGHRKILPIRYPAANANPTMAKTTRTAKTSTLTLSPAAAIVGVLAATGEIGKEIKASRDEDGAECAGSTKSLVRIRFGLDTLEVRFGAAGEFHLVEGTRVGGTRCEQRPAAAREELDHRLDLPVGEGRCANDPVPRRKLPGLVLESGRVVRAVPNLVRTSPIQAARQVNLHLAVDRAAQERLRGLLRAAGSDPAGIRHESCPFRLAENNDCARLHDGELLTGDRLARLAEDVGVVERDVRQQDDAR